MMHAENLELYNWKYLAEGNSSIVFACLEEKIVLRIKKRSRDDKPLGSVGKNFSLEREKMYVQKTLRPLVRNDRYFAEMEIVVFSENFKQELMKLVVSSSERPDERSSAGGTSLDLQNSGLLMDHLGFYKNPNHPDTCYADKSFAIEIKPKWGFMPKTSSQLLAKSCPKTETCRFCMQQHLKFKEHTITIRSSYCPLDLFAKCACRLKRALRSLFDEPQNNLRVFHNGDLIFSGLAVNGAKLNLDTLNHHLKDLSASVNKTDFGVEQFISIISCILIHDSQKDETVNNFDIKQCSAVLSPICASKKGATQDSIKNKCYPLGSNGILQSLLKLQQLDDANIDDIHSIYHWLKETKIFDIESLLEDFDSQNWHAFLNNISCTAGTFDESTVDEVLFQIQMFLVSATFRDCSIMITFKEAIGLEASQENVVTDSLSGCKYAYTIKLIDVDSKRIHKINHYKKLNDDIITTYLQYIDTSTANYESAS